MFTVHYNATISSDHVWLSNTTTGETVARKASPSFSSENCLIADPETAASFLGDLLREVEGRRRWLRFFPTVNVTISGEPRAELDREDVKRLFTEQGFVRVKVT
jgi:hypothetical protein